MSGTASLPQRDGADELRDAIATQRSWLGVARVLGLNAMSAGTIRALKRRATELQLDASHFTHQRTWSDTALKDAIAASTTWAEALHLLGLSGGDGRRRLRGHAIRLGVDITHLDGKPCVGLKVDFKDVRAEVSLLREAAEAYATAWFTLRGFPVAIPSQRCSYDLLVTFPEGVQRIQVKTTTFRGKQGGTWTVNVGQRPYVLDKTAARTAYDPDSVDYFFIIDGDYVVYLIPSTLIAGRLAINVGAYAAYRVGDASSLFALPA